MTGSRAIERTALLTLLVAVVSLVAGCGSSPPVHYYSLDALEAGYGAPDAGTPRFGVGPFRMPDYLTRSNIVTRGNASEVNIDDYHRWIEPVNEALHRIVAANLATMMSDVVAVGFPYRFLNDSELRVVGRVERFDADDRGQVQLIVQWGITTADSSYLVPPRREIYRSQAADARDYNAIAAAMSTALLEFSRDIAGAHATIDDR